MILRLYFRSIPFLIIFFLCMLAIALTGFFAGAFIGVSNNSHLIEYLEEYRPALVTSVYDRSGEHLLAEFYRQYRETRSLGRMPDDLINAFLAIEDQRFYEHSGIVPQRIVRAAIINLQQGRISQGASTITQQLAKNLVAGTQRTITRKFMEMLISFQIERHYSKDQILELYLNHIFLGDRDHNAHGVQSAAKAYFGKNVEDLTLAECATIAGMPKAPNMYSPARNPEASLRRRNYILYRMRYLGFITEEEYEEAVNEPIQVDTYRPPKNEKAPYFVEYMKRKLANHPDIGYDGLYHRGLKIHTTLDMDIQEVTDRHLKEALPEIEARWQHNRNERGLYLWEKDEPLKTNWRHLVRIDRVTEDTLYVSYRDYRSEIELPDPLPYHQPDQILRPNYFVEITVLSIDEENKRFEAKLNDETILQGAAVVLENATGNILAMTGGYDFFDEDNNGQWNRATQAYRQVGSTIKPFFFAGVLEDLHYTPGTVIIDEELVYYYAGEEWAPRNYENRFFGPTTIQEAMEHSRNIIAVKVLNNLGLRRGIQWLNDFGLEENHRRSIPRDLTLSLGSMDGTALEIARAYLPFSRDGIYINTEPYSAIYDLSGEMLMRRPVQERINMSDENAYLMTSMMQGVIQRGTGYESVGANWPSEFPELAGKTGTTDKTTDAWFAGYSPEYTVVVLVAFDQKRSLGEGMSGGRVAGPIFRDIMYDIYEMQETRQKEFPVPSRIVHRDICGESGQLLSRPCLETRNELIARGQYGSEEYYHIYRDIAFKEGTEPQKECEIHAGKGEDEETDNSND